MKYEKRISEQDLKEHLADEIRSGKHDAFLLENRDNFNLILLKAKMKAENEAPQVEPKSGGYDPLSINP